MLKYLLISCIVQIYTIKAILYAGTACSQRVWLGTLAPSHRNADSEVAGFWDVPHSSLSPGDTHWDKAKFL